MRHRCSVAALAIVAGVSAAGAAPKSVVPVAPVKICVVITRVGEQATVVVTATLISVAP